MVEALPAEIHNIVVSPLPWSPAMPFINGEKAAFAAVPFHFHYKGREVYYPKYFMLPKVSGACHAALIVARTYPLVKRLAKQHDIELMHAHWIYPDGVAAAWLAQKLCLPLVLSARGCDINLYGQYRFRRSQIKWALQHADAITTVSDSLRHIIAERFHITKNVTTIRNGVDRGMFKKINKTHAREITGLEKNGRYLLFAGQLHEVKGLRYLIEALNILNSENRLNFTAILLGDGPERNVLENRIAGLRLHGKVMFAGYKPHDEVANWMNACDVFCLPSIREGTPNVILEAMACGLPVIASRVGGIPEIIEEDRGCLVPPRDPAALADAIVQAFDADISAGDTGSWEDCALQYMEIYSEVLKKGKRLCAEFSG